jgi:hypothetical protein
LTIADSKASRTRFGGFNIVVGDVIPDLVDVPLRTRREYETLHFLARFRWALRLRISVKVALPSTNSPQSASALPMATSFPQLRKPQLFQLLFLLKQPQTFPQDFTLSLVMAGLKEIGNKLIEHGSEIHIHTRTIPPLTTVVNC